MNGGLVTVAHRSGDLRQTGIQQEIECRQRQMQVESKRVKNFWTKIIRTGVKKILQEQHQLHKRLN
jgi:hypothetical protein